jgi:hypothetical protein
MKAWQLPISRRQQGRKVLHYFLVSAATNALSPAACGRKFNPGFATPDYGVNGFPKCHYCQAANAREAT